MAAKVTPKLDSSAERIVIQINWFKVRIKVSKVIVFINNNSNLMEAQLAPLILSKDMDSLLKPNNSSLNFRSNSNRSRWRGKMEDRLLVDTNWCRAFPKMDSWLANRLPIPLLILEELLRNLERVLDHLIMDTTLKAHPPQINNSYKAPRTQMPSNKSMDRRELISIVPSSHIIQWQIRTDPIRKPEVVIS